MEQQSPTNLFNQMTGTVLFPPVFTLNALDEQSIFQDDLSQGESPHTDIFLEHDEEDNEDSALGVTKVIKKLPNGKKKYDNITNEMRLKLIDAVENKGQKIKHAAKKLNINYSSAKSICQVFKREGRSNKKAFKRRDFKNENIIQSKPENPPCPSNLRLELSNSAIQPLRLPEPLPEQAEPQDSLMALRDRLLGSRLDSKQASLQVPLKLDISNAASNESAYSILQSTKAATPSDTKVLPQLDMQKSYFGQQIMLEQASQQKQSYVLNGMPGQAIYMMPNGVPLNNSLAPMVITGQQQPQSIIPNNFGSMISQSMTPAGPTQTININQPYAKNMSIQTIALPENNSASKVSPAAYPNIVMNQKPVSTPVQQVPYYMSGYPNLIMNSLGGTQPTIIQQAPVYMMQQGNLIQMGSYPQVIQAGSNYGVAYNPNYTLNYMNVQPIGVYRLNNQTNIPIISDPRLKVAGIQQQQPSLGSLQGSASMEK